MLNWFDPKFLIPSVLAIAALVFQIKSYNYQRGQRILTLENLQNVSMATVHKSMHNRVKVAIGNHSVHDLRWVVIRLRNTSRIPISPDEFQGDIRISFSNGAKVLESRIVANRTASVMESGELPVVNECDIHLRPMLLNQGDWVRIGVLVESFNGYPKVHAPIPNVRVRYEHSRITRASVLKAINHVVAITFLLMVAKTSSIVTINVSKLHEFEPLFLGTLIYVSYLLIEDEETWPYSSLRKTAQFLVPVFLLCLAAAYFVVFVGN